LSKFPVTHSNPCSAPAGGMVDAPNANVKCPGGYGTSYGAGRRGEVTRAENDPMVNGPLPWFVIRRT
jgi:hypothetical protein